MKSWGNERMWKVIGIIFHQRKIALLRKGLEPYEYLPFYTRLARHYGCDLFFYSWQELLLDRSLKQGYYYNWQKARWQYGALPVPKVNLFRAKLPSRQERARQFLPYHQASDVQFLNLPWEMNKATISKVLAANPRLQPYLPWTQPLTLTNLQTGLNQYGQILVKPIFGSKGSGIRLIEQRGQGVWQADHMRSKGRIAPTLRWSIIGELTDWISSIGRPERFLIQQFLPLTRYAGSPLDLRISVQKGREETWAITGKVLRVAAAQDFVTNVARGGKVLSFSAIASRLTSEQIEQLEWLAYEVAQTIADWSPGVMDLGLDLALDEEGKLWFIEANFCDQRYAYREVGDITTWYTTYAYPIGYAYSKLEAYIK